MWSWARAHGVRGWQCGQTQLFYWPLLHMGMRGSLQNVSMFFTLFSQLPWAIRHLRNLWRHYCYLKCILKPVSLSNIFTWCFHYWHVIKQTRNLSMLMIRWWSGYLYVLWHHPRARVVLRKILAAEQSHEPYIVSTSVIVILVWLCCNRWGYGYFKLKMLSLKLWCIYSVEILSCVWFLCFVCM